jgi:hypothetical protein
MPNVRPMRTSIVRGAESGASGTGGGSAPGRSEGAGVIA